jgi:PAS domain-containing protein
MSQSSALFSLSGPAAVRALARAFSEFHEFDRFVQGLQGALNQSDHFDHLTINMDRGVAEGARGFAAGNLTMPLGGNHGQFGSLQVAPLAPPRQFGPEDLHLMAGLADFLSVALTQALLFQDLSRSRELLRFLLNQAPVGIAALGPDRRVLVANDLAMRWLAEVTVPFEELLKNPGGFHLRANGKLIFGEARRRADDASGSWIVVLHDLTPEQGRLLELVQRETYRALVDRRRFSLALIERAGAGDGILQRLPALRAALLPGETAGPYDAHRLALAFCDRDGIALRARLRKLRTVFGEAANLRLGYAELGRDGRTPEALLAAALQRHGNFDEILRPALLVYDGNRAVADTLAMVLGKEFKVVKSSSPERTRELLGQEHFEGFLTELELGGGVSGFDLARHAREKQPGIRQFITTVQRAPYGLPAGMLDAAEATVIEKPFDVTQLTDAVRAKLAGG